MDSSICNICYISFPCSVLLVITSGILQLPSLLYLLSAGASPRSWVLSLFLIGLLPHTIVPCRTSSVMSPACEPSSLVDLDLIFPTHWEPVPLLALLWYGCVPRNICPRNLSSHLYVSNVGEGGHFVGD